MKRFNTQGISEKIRSFEAKTGFELIVAAAESSDPYPGANWRGGLILGLIVSSLLLHFYAFEPRSLEVLLVGAVILACTMIVKYTGLSRIFHLNSETERETSEKAAELFSHFHAKDLGHEASVLLFFSFRERKIHLLVDSYLKEKLDQQDLLEIITLIRLHFRSQHIELGIEKAVETLEAKVLSKVGKNPSPPVLTVEDRIFWF
ncbi:MAG: hypothetical protein ACLGG7_11775 [Bacteriovoracia bacterium]